MSVAVSAAVICKYIGGDRYAQDRWIRRRSPPAVIEAGRGGFQTRPYENSRLRAFACRRLRLMLFQRPVDAAHHRLERRAHDVAVDADAEQRLLAVDAHLH